MGTEQLDVETVRRLPPSPGLSFRGRGSGTWQLGEWYTAPDWLRTSRDPRIATGDFATRDVVALFGACGRDLHDGRAGQVDHETVFLPGSRFTVLRKGFLGTTWLQVVVVARDDERPERPSDVDVQVRRAVAAVRAAQAAPPAGVSVLDRFVGGFGTPGDAPTTPTVPARRARPRRALRAGRRQAAAGSA